MRDIKFRAWDNGMEMMVYQGDDEIYICFDGEKWKLLDYYGTHWETDEYGMNEIEQPWEVENIEIMQYTGMKDVKGVEIYDGDIVKASSQGIWGKFQVKWRQDGSPCWFMYPAWKSGVAWSLHGTINDKGEYQDSVEVIGNIYENPELLEDLKNG